MEEFQVKVPPTKFFRGQVLQVPEEAADPDEAADDLISIQTKISRPSEDLSCEIIGSSISCGNPRIIDEPFVDSISFDEARQIRHKSTRIKIKLSEMSPNEGQLISRISTDISKFLRRLPTATFYEISVQDLISTTSETRLRSYFEGEGWIIHSIFTATGEMWRFILP